MSWKPSILTQNVISDFIEDLLDFLPEQLGIEEIISACEVISLDPQGLGLATFPRPIICRVNNYYQLVQYRGGLPALVVGDFVTVVHLREGNRYEVLGMGGSGGIAPDPNGLPCEVSVVRGCTITPYADPDDAFTNANMAGDVILVPEGTWTLSANHTMTNGTSIVGLGGHPETCILQATASVGVDLITTGNQCFVFNVRIRYISAAGAARTALHVTSTSEALLVDAYCQETAGEPWGIDVDGGRAELCTAYAVDQTTGKPIGIEVESGGHIYRCEGRALHATVGEAVGINLSIGSNTARWCRGEGQDIAGTSYGISSDTGTNIIEWCEADGETTDIYVLSGTLSLFSCQYASTAGAGTIAYLPGDHQVMDLDADTYIRALATDDQIDIVVAGNPWGSITAARFALDDGVGDSPRIDFVGGSNNDTGYIFLEDDAVAFNSDLVIGIPGPDADARVIFRSTAPADVAYIDGAGNAFFSGDVLLTDDHFIGITGDIRIEFDSSDGDIMLRLGDAAGADQVQIVDSGGGVVAYIDSDGDAEIKGHVFIGANAGAPGPTIICFVREVMQQVAGSIFGLQFQVDYNPPANFAASVYGALGRVRLGTAFTKTGGALYGMRGTVEIAGGIDARNTTLRGGYFYVDVEDAGSAAGNGAGDAIGCLVETPRVDTGRCAVGYGIRVLRGSLGTGRAGITIDTQYGIYIHDVSHATVATAYGIRIENINDAATNWAIYSSGGASYHGGTLAVGGTTAAAGQLHVDNASNARPVLYLDQGDVSEEMIEFATTIGIGNAIEAIGVKTLTTTHFIKVTLPGALTRYFPVGTIA